MHTTSLSEYFCLTSIVLNTFWVWCFKWGDGVRRRTLTVWQVCRFGHISYFNVCVFTSSSSLQVTASGDWFFCSQKKSRFLKCLKSWANLSLRLGQGSSISWMEIIKTWQCWPDYICHPAPSQDKSVWLIWVQLVSLDVTECQSSHSNELGNEVVWLIGCRWSSVDWWSSQ